MILRARKLSSNHRERSERNCLKRKRIPIATNPQAIISAMGGAEIRLIVPAPRIELTFCTCISRMTIQTTDLAPVLFVSP